MAALGHAGEELLPTDREALTAESHRAEAEVRGVAAAAVEVARLRTLLAVREGRQRISGLGINRMLDEGQAGHNWNDNPD